MTLLRSISFIVFALLASLSFVISANEIIVEAIEFPAGESSTTLKGNIQGDNVIDYTLNAKSGQTLGVNLATGNSANYFNILPPGSEAALFIGSTSGHAWEGQLPIDGEYRIRVYLMRSAARRDESANYTLTISVTENYDAKVAGTPYHAMGFVPCSVGTDPKGSANCSFSVIRKGPDKAEVYLAPVGYDVTLHKDQLRVLNFNGNTVTTSNADEKISFEKQADNWIISINGFYFYVIPEAVISGD